MRICADGLPDPYQDKYNNPDDGFALYQWDATYDWHQVMWEYQAIKNGVRHIPEAVYTKGICDAKVKQCEREIKKILQELGYDKYEDKKSRR